MDVHDYSARFKKLIARERNAEIDFHTNEVKTLAPFKREKKGRCLTAMKRQDNSKLESNSIFRFVKGDGNKFPPNEFSIGANVIISIKDPLNDGLKGSVVSKSQMFIDVYLPNQSRMINHGSLRIDLFVNDTTYNVQNEILEGIHKWSFEKGQMREIILHNKKPELGSSTEVTLFNQDLNPSQKLAVNYAMREKEFYLIQGPPGTGKTQTSIEIVRQYRKQDMTVLISADSNMAVDNIMLGLLKYNVNVIRIGESPKIMEEIQEHTLSHLIEGDFQYRIVADGLKQIKKLRETQRECIIPNKKNNKGLSYFQIRKFAERSQSDFGISAEDMKSMARWISSQEDVKNLQSRIDKVKQKIIKDCVNGASVICTTNSNANSQYLDKMEFDLVLIDEAGQSTEPSCLIPISKSKKVILVGDHKQLPPTILSREAKELGVSLFERMMTNCRYTLLDTQYRMNPIINEFPSNEFYDGKLKSAPNTETHNIENRIFEKNVVFIECFGDEKKFKGATSFYNPAEIEIVLDLVLKYKEKGLEKDDIGVISPYGEQVKQIKERMPFVEVNSIDGFQGREKKIIIISLTRSNDRNQIGFLKDLRRLNVALTRAICELVVIGNPKTISSEKTYEDFMEFVKNNGTYISEKEISDKLK